MNLYYPTLSILVVWYSMTMFLYSLKLNSETLKLIDDHTCLQKQFKELGNHTSRMASINKIKKGLLPLLSLPATYAKVLVILKALTKIQTTLSLARRITHLRFMSCSPAQAFVFTRMKVFIPAGIRVWPLEKLKRNVTYPLNARIQHEFLKMDLQWKSSTSRFLKVSGYNPVSRPAQWKSSLLFSAR